MKDFLTGDLIYFKETAGSRLSNHIGMIVKDKQGNISLFHCSGWKNVCEHNLSALAGVRAIHLTPIAVAALVWYCAYISPLNLYLGNTIV